MKPAGESSAQVIALEDNAYMRRALDLARKAEAAGEVPVGAVLVLDGNLIGEGWNRPIGSSDPTSHAEIEALRAGARHLGNYRLGGSTLYVTMEPCPMCSGAIVLARIPTVVFGCYDPKMGACGSLYTIPEDKRLNHRAHVIAGVMDAEAGSLLKDFFKGRRDAAE